MIQQPETSEQVICTLQVMGESANQKCPIHYEDQVPPQVWLHSSCSNIADRFLPCSLQGLCPSVCKETILFLYVC